MFKVFTLVLCVLLLSTAGSLALAQPDDAKQRQLVEMTQEADIIVQARVIKLEPKEGGFTFRMGSPSPSAEGVLKGRQWLTKGFFVPAGSESFFEPNKIAIVFARYDPVRNTNVVLEGEKAKREASPETVQQIQSLLQTQPRAKITMQAARPQYRMGEKIELLWKVKNTSLLPFRLFIGKNAIGHGVFINNRGSNPSVYKNEPRAESDYVLLKPGEEWSATRETSKNFVEGQALIRMALRNHDNIVNAGGTNAGKRYAEVLLLDEETEFNLTILPPDDATIEKLAQQLSSPFWDEQLSALDVLSKTAKGRALPQMSSLLKHPWDKVRQLAAYSIAWNSPTFDSPLRELLFNPEASIRIQTLEIMRDRRIQGAGLSLLALRLVSEDAIDNGLVFLGMDEGQDAESLKKKLHQLNDHYFPIVQQRTNDARVGDILATLLQEGRDNGYVLMFLVDLQSKLRLKSSGETTDEQKQALLQAWEVRRKDVEQLYSMADLEAEMNEARSKIFGATPHRYDDPQVIALRDLLAKIRRDDSNTKYEDSLKELKALGTASVPQLVEFLSLPGNNNRGYASLPLYQVLTDWKTMAAFDVWLARAYEGDVYVPWFLASLDPQRARPHLEHLFLTLPDERNKKLGAALGLVKLGDKRGVPLLFEVLGRYDSAWEKRAIEALKPLTGQNFATTQEWVKWWKGQGSKQTWQ